MGPGFFWKSESSTLLALLHSHIGSHLNTHDVALENFDVGEHHLDFGAWRAPMVASTGSYSTPHQDTNGLGATLYCASGYKAFLLPIDAYPPIVKFKDIHEDIELGWEYQYYPPYSFGAFVLSSGQTL